MYFRVRRNVLKSELGYSIEMLIAKVIAKIGSTEIVLSMKSTWSWVCFSVQIGSSADLKCLFVLLLEQYNPQLQSKQYLQDLIATNHTLLQFLDDVSKMPDYDGYMKMEEHIKQ